MGKKKKRKKEKEKKKERNLSLKHRVWRKIQPLIQFIVIICLSERQWVRKSIHNKLLRDLFIFIFARFSLSRSVFPPIHAGRHTLYHICFFVFFLIQENGWRVKYISLHTIAMRHAKCYPAELLLVTSFFDNVLLLRFLFLSSVAL